MRSLPPRPKHALAAAHERASAIPPALLDLLALLVIAQWARARKGGE